MFKLAAKGFLIASAICILLFFIALSEQNISVQLLEYFGIFVTYSIVCFKFSAMDENIEKLEKETKRLTEEVHKLQQK